MNYTNIQNGLQINGTGPITGITASGSLSSNSYTIPTESIVKSYYDNNFLSTSTYYSQTQFNANFTSATTSYYTQSQYYTNLLSNSGMSFASLSQTATYWIGMTTTSNGNIYASVYHNTVGDIYMKTGGTGNFFALGQGNANWIKMATDSNGVVYCAVLNGQIWKQTGGTGNFFVMSQVTTRNWRGMCADKKGNVYATVGSTPGQGIYKYTGGTSDFFAVYLNANNWYDLACASNGDIYACMYGGDIYKSTGGTDNFYALGQTSRNWYGMTADLSGSVYACVYDATAGDIYKQYGGTGNFIAQNTLNVNWAGMTVAPNGDVYACQYLATGNIWKNTYTTRSFSPYYTQSQMNSNFLSASTSYSQSQMISNFLSANTLYTQSQMNSYFLSANTQYAYGSLYLASGSFTIIGGSSTYNLVSGSSLTVGPTSLTRVSVNGLITATTAGDYLINYWVGTSSANNFNTQIIKNASTIIHSCPSGATIASGSLIATLAAKDNIGIYVKNGGASVQFLTYSLSLVKII